MLFPYLLTENEILKVEINILFYPINHAQQQQNNLMNQLELFLTIHNFHLQLNNQQFF